MRWVCEPLFPSHSLANRVQYFFVFLFYLLFHLLCIPVLFLCLLFFSLCVCVKFTPNYFSTTTILNVKFIGTRRMFMMISIGVWCASFGVARVILTTHKKKNSKRSSNYASAMNEDDKKKMHELTLTFHISRYWNFLWSFHSVSGQLIHTFRIYVCVVELLALEIRGVCCIIYIRWMLVPSYTCGKRGTSSATTRP